MTPKLNSVFLFLSSVSLLIQLSQKPEVLSVYRALHHAAHFAVSKDASKTGEYLANWQPYIIPLNITLSHTEEGKVKIPNSTSKEAISQVSLILLSHLFYLVSVSFNSSSLSTMTREIFFFLNVLSVNEFSGNISSSFI